MADNVVVLSARQVESIRPREDGPSYRVAPLTVFERARFRAELVARGCSFVSVGDLCRILRGAVDQIAPDNADALRERIDQHEAAGGENAEIAEEIAALCDALRRHVPEIDRFAADRLFYNQIAPLVAAAAGLRGWEGTAAEPLPAFRRRNGVVPDDLLEAVPPADLYAIGHAAIRLMTVSETARKNSASPSPSAEALTASPPNG